MDPWQRWRQLGLIAGAQLLAMSVWFAGSAVAPLLSKTLELTSGQTSWLTSGVQLGFVIGTLVAAILNLPDLIPSRWYVAGAAAIAAIANAMLLVSHSFGPAFGSRLLTGVALAGVYPPAMKMAATWFMRSRGMAIGCVVGALTAGKAMPYLLEGGAHLSLNAGVLVPSFAALLAAAIVALGYQDGPHKFPSRPFSLRLVGEVVRRPELRRITGGYLGHMWELYAFWAWIPAFLTASFAKSGAGGDAGLWPFLCVAIGAAGAVYGGVMADQIGRVIVVRVALFASGVCCLASAFVFGGHPAVTIVVCLIWGVAVIADSAQFSAMVTESAPPHAVGTALTLQTSLGFLLTIATIQGVPRVAEAVGWRWAMVPLAFGPIIALSILREVAQVVSAVKPMR